MSHLFPTTTKHISAFPFSFAYYNHLATLLKDYLLVIS